MKTLLIATMLLGFISIHAEKEPETTVSDVSDHLNSTKARPLVISPGNVVAIRELTLKPDVKPEDFERFVNEEFTPTFEEQVPGVKAYILKGERGDKKGQYSFALIFDSINTRDYYYPFEHGGEASVPKTAEPLWMPARKVVFEKLAEYVEDIGEQRGYTDYVVMGDQPIVAR